MTEERIIIVTPEKVAEHEPALWIELLEAGIGKIHVRKIGLSSMELADLIDRVPMLYRKRLVMHHDMPVALEKGTGGVHLPYQRLISGKIIAPAGFSLSASTHSWEEVLVAMKMCAYCFVSPVFNSISKKGYEANPALKEVPDTLKGKRIYALGGVHNENLQQALDMGYFGVAVLGYVWDTPSEAVGKVRQLMDKLGEKMIS